MSGLHPDASADSGPKGVLSLLWSFLVLGCTSFGGPVAHIGYFRTTFVARKNWLSDETFASYLSLCQFIPGPASSQLGMAIGYHRHGYAGALAAWLGFTLPSALLLFSFAMLLAYDSVLLNSGVTQGLKVVALAVIVQAFLAMRVSLAPDIPRLLIVVLAVALFLVWRSPLAPICVLGLVGVFCAVVRRELPKQDASESCSSSSQREASALALVWLVLFFGIFLLALLPLGMLGEQFLAYYRSGAMVFGGGHVVLPLLEGEIVDAGWVDRNTFLTGYGAAQAVPGPLFTFSAFLGASHESGAVGVAGALLAVAAIFLPSFLLLFGVLPFWSTLQHRSRVRSALWGINAAVLGLLLATIINPVIQESIHDWASLFLAILAFVALYVFKAPVALVVLGGALSGGLLL